MTESDIFSIITEARERVIGRLSNMSPARSIEFVNTLLSLPKMPTYLTGDEETLVWEMAKLGWEDARQFLLKEYRKVEESN